MTGSLGSGTYAPPEHLAYLDGWRALAIISLLWGHFFPVGYINLGAFGVELFFVLSGRLMAEILLVRRIDIGNFLRRRISRIVPALFVFATATVLFAQLSPLFGSDYSRYAGWPSHLAALLFMVNYYDFFSDGAWWLNHLWSLAVEEHCYLLLALIAVWSTRDKRRAALAALGIGLLCMISGALQAILLDMEGHDLYWRTDVRAASVLIPFGLYLAAKAYLARENGQWRILVAPACLALGFLLSTNSFPEWVRYSLGTLSLALAVVTLDVAAKPLLRLLGARPLTWIGLISFSLYLWQQPFYVQRMSIGVWPALGACVALALLSYFAVEKPARRYLNAHWRPGGSRPVPVAVASPAA